MGGRRARVAVARGRAARIVAGLGRATAGAVVAAGVAATAAAALPADPPTGGVSPVAATPEPDVTARFYGAPAPRVERIACVRDCGDAGTARAGGLVRVWGRNVQRVTEVAFLAGPGGADDTSVAPRATRRRSVVARVPRTTASGPVAVALADGARSAPSRDALVIDASAPVPAAHAVDVEVQRRKVFYGAERGAELSYVLGGAEPATVAVELVRAADAAVIARWTHQGVLPGIPGTVSWDGTAGGAVQRDGLYRFRARAVSDAGAAASSPEPAQAALASSPEPAQAALASSPEPAQAALASDDGADAGASAEEAGAFMFLRHHFPIAGAHTYGTGGATFGGGRGHLGEDVFAECGTPVVAARGGSVKFKQFEARAGHYVVMDGAGTEVDYAYMHLRDAALVEAGDRVRTGALIGYVGATGRADGCHLHFEMWSGPGWYAGGAAFDPLPQLKAWDAES